MIGLSEIIFSVPVIFCAMTNSQIGPALTRAIVNIVKQVDDLSWMEYQTSDATWGAYNDQHDIDRQMMTLIQDDPGSTFHYFQ